MQTTGTPVAINQAVRTFNNSKTGQSNFVHDITMQYPDGRQETGQYISTAPQCTKFVVGAQISFDRDVRQNGNYTNIIFKPLQEGGQKKWSGGSSGGNSLDKASIIVGHKVELASKALEGAFHILAATGVADGISIFDAVKQHTEKNMEILMEVSGLNKYVAAYTAEKAAAVAAAAATPAPNPNPAPVYNPPAVQQQPFNQASNSEPMVTDDLPF